MSGVISIDVAEKILAALAGLPAVNDIGESVVQAVREAELLHGIIDRFVIVHPDAVASAGHVDGVAGLGVKLDVEKLRAEAPSKGKAGTTDRRREA